MSQQSNRDNFSMAVYVISVAAELSGMHPQTLRNYERVGLLRPARTQGGNRRYSQADIARLHRIAQLVDSGMNLEGIRHVLELEPRVAVSDRLGLAQPQLARRRAQDDLVEAHVNLHFSRGRLDGFARHFTGQHFVEHDAERIDVRAMIGAAAVFLLRERR